MNFWDMGVLMRTNFSARMRGAVSAVSLTVLFSTSAVVGTVVGLTLPASAQTLTADQTSSLSTSLTAAINAANGNATAIEAAIAQAVEGAIATYGPGAAASITSAVLTIAEQAGATPAQIGNGLGQAAVAENSTNPAAAGAIATTTGAEGKGNEVTAFDSSTTGAGLTNLAALANNASGTAVGSTNAGGVGGAGGAGGGTTGGAGNGGGGGGGCLNPSCTAL